MKDLGSLNGVSAGLPPPQGGAAAWWEAADRPLRWEVGLLRGSGCLGTWDLLCELGGGGGSEVTGEGPDWGAGRDQGEEPVFAVETGQEGGRGALSRAGHPSVPCLSVWAVSVWVSCFCLVDKSLRGDACCFNKKAEPPASTPLCGAAHWCCALSPSSLPPPPRVRCSRKAAREAVSPFPAGLERVPAGLSLLLHPQRQRPLRPVVPTELGQRLPA